MPPPLAILLAVACAALAYVIGRLTLRLRGHYLPLATLAWGIAAYVRFVAAIEVTGGASGLSNIPPLRVLGMEFGTRAMGALAWAAVGLAYIAYCRIYRGRMGRAARHQVQPDHGRGLGVDVAAAKIRIFVLSAALAALAGGLYAFYMSFLSPTSFSIGASFNLLIMVVLGGCLHPLGPLLGVLAYTAIELGAQYLIANLLGIPGQMETMLFGLIPDRGAAALAQRAADLGPAETTGAARRRRRAAPARAPGHGRPAPERGRRAQALRRAAGAQGRDAGHSARTHHRPDRPERRRQVHPVQRDDRGAAGQRRTGLAGRRGAAPARAHEVVRRGVARSFQHVQLVPEPTVLDNVLIGGHIQGKAGLLSAALGLDRAEERRLAREARRAGAGRPGGRGVAPGRQPDAGQPAAGRGGARP